MALKYLDALVPPIYDQVVDSSRGFVLTDIWRRWFGRIPSVLTSIPNVLSAVSVSTQAASIGATNFRNIDPGSGLYRLTYHVRISRAATTSSSLQVHFSWTEGGVAQTFNGVTITANVTTASQTESLMIRNDDGTAANYSTTYASSPAGEMQYSLDVTLEKFHQ